MIFVKSSLHSSSETCYTVQLLLPPRRHPYLPHPIHFQLIPMLFSCQISWSTAFLNFFLTLNPQLSHSTSLQLYSWLYAFFSSLCSSSYFRDNSLTFSGLLPDHFFIWARHPLQVVLSPPNVSSTLCPLLLQPCFFPTSSTASEDLSWGLRCIYICKVKQKVFVKLIYAILYIWFPFQKHTHDIKW